MRSVGKIRASVRRSKKEDGSGRVKDGLVAVLFLVGNDQGLRKMSATLEAHKEWVTRGGSPSCILSLLSCGI